jgi:dTDP-4-amino-4,6-dideoxygalactose transaminase
MLPAVKKLPFNRAWQVGTELDYVRQAIEAGHVSGDGHFTRRSQAMLEQLTGAGKALLTTSGTHALDMAALLLDIDAGDEVILPSFTFVSTANAFVLRGAMPVFADSRPDTLNIDDRQLEALITPRTRAIVVVHYAGVACDMEAILRIARERRLPVVEDNAHGLFATCNGRALGSFGDLAALSFHETKNISCGEGGALLINDPALVARAEIIREKGTNRSAFFRGQVDKYTWMDLGSSYLPSDMLAAVLWAQLEARDAIQRRRLEIWQRYYAALAAWGAASGVRLPIVPDYAVQPGHLFYLLMPDADDRDGLIRHLADRGIHAAFHYVPLHASPMGQRWPLRAPCPIAEDAAARLVRLPIFVDLDPDSQQRVIDGVTSYVTQCALTDRHSS